MSDIASGIDIDDIVPQSQVLGSEAIDSESDTETWGPSRYRSEAAALESLDVPEFPRTAHADIGMRGHLEECYARISDLEERLDASEASNAALRLRIVTLSDDAHRAIGRWSDSYEALMERYNEINFAYEHMARNW